ncbi:MAG: hypothetical protein PHH00_04000 [Candidatus Nanoarchaeia archaeon]|nr:hypothetical protein [Candidatus Nanoarchaeia archaeon]
MRNKATFVLGLILFFLVMTVFYFVLFVPNDIERSSLQPVIPFVVFSGFFIFLVGAMLVALSIFRAVSGRRG